MKNFKMMENVKSGNISGIGYNEKAKSLLVEFSYGGKYVYEDVPEDVYVQLQDSESVGKFVAREIKGTYEFKKVG